MQPDGMAVIPWYQEQLLVWNTAYPDTLAASYLSPATSASGTVAAAAEERMIRKYSHLDQVYLSVSVVIKTLDVFGPNALAFVRELGRRIHRETGEEIYSTAVLGSQVYHS